MLMSQSTPDDTVFQGLERGNPYHWIYPAFMVLGGLWMMWVSYRLIVAGPVVKVWLGSVSLRAPSRTGFVWRALLFGAIGLGGILVGALMITTMLFGWPKA